MTRPTKAQRRALASLAGFAQSCHEWMVDKGEHTPGLPLPIQAVADAFGVDMGELLSGTNWDATDAADRAVGRR